MKTTIVNDSSGKPDALKGACPVWGWGRAVMHALHHHPDGRPAGYAKNNRTGQETRWAAKGYVLDENQKRELHEQAKQHVAERTEEIAKTQDKAAKRVQKQTEKFTTPELPTSYLANKQVDLHPGIYVNGNSTCIPLYNVSGEMRSMAYIQEDGTKRYAKDTQKEGSFHVIGGQDELAKSPAIVLSEGYATAATVTESIGFATVAVMDAANLVDVAKALHEAMPDKPIIIAGDDDAHQEAENGNNPGKKYANQAAQETGGVAVFPTFTTAEHGAKEFSDFNDLATKSEMGREAVKDQLAPVVEQQMEKHQIREQAQEKTQEQELLR